MMENDNNIKVIDILYKEYEIAGERIEDYQRSHFRYYSGILLFLIAIFTFFSGQTIKSLRLELIPYPLFFISTLIYYHYHRTLVIQGYRRVIGQEINKLIKKNVLLFHSISDKFIISPQGNISIGLFSILNISFIIFIIEHCSVSSENNIHRILQYILLFFNIMLYAYSTFVIQKRVEIDVLNTFTKAADAKVDK